MGIDTHLTRATAVEKYQASLTNFRSRLGLPEWTEDGKQACLLFKHARGTVSESDIRRRAEEAGIILSQSGVRRIYNRVKFATVVFKKKTSVLLNELMFYLLFANNKSK